MKVVIIEDEITASENLVYLLNQIDTSIEVLSVIDTVKASISYFSEPNDAELVFMDIHLADGISFEIFKQVQIKIPIIFTTAYDQYAIQAFKVNSIDYLLKPLNNEELSGAIDKLKKLTNTQQHSDQQMKGLLALLQEKNKSYKTTYLVQKRDELVPVKVANIAYFYIETGIVKAVTFQKENYIINKKLEDIETELDPAIFLRVNRQFILNKNAIVNLKFYFNGKLIVKTEPSFSERIVISKAKANEVKDWMNT